jgi:hypothetical protein
VASGRVINTNKGHWVTISGRRMFIQDGVKNKETVTNRRSGSNGKQDAKDPTNKLRNGKTGSARKSTVANLTPKKRGTGSRNTAKKKK